MNILRKMSLVALWAWQLPQNLIGLALVAVWRPMKKERIEGLTVAFKVPNIVKDTFSQGLSLGDFIFLEESCGSRAVRHELGHSRQSRVLGPIYLLAIGVPSFIWAFIYSRSNKKKAYYSFYTERWANKLGGLL